jgi:hypothetical protein
VTVQGWPPVFCFLVLDPQFLFLLRDIHCSLLSNYVCKDTTPPQSQCDTGVCVGLIGERTLPMLLSSRPRIFTCVWSGVSRGGFPQTCKSDLIIEMIPGLLVSGRLSLSLVSVLIYRPWWSYLCQSVVARSFICTPQGVISPLVPPTRQPKKPTTGRRVDQITDLFHTTHKMKT